MAITEDNEKIPTPTLGNGKHENSNTAPTPTATLGKSPNENTAPVPKAVENSDITSTPGMFGGMSPMRSQANEIKEQTQRMAQAQSRTFAGMTTDVPPLPQLRSTFVKHASGYLKVNNQLFEVIVSDIEEFFADFISELSLKKRIEKLTEETLKAVRVTVFIARDLREHLIKQCQNACLIEDNIDPFFIRHEVPYLLPVLEADMDDTNERINLGDYIYRLHRNFPALQSIPMQYSGCVTNFIKVGLKDNKHYLIMPKAEELLELVEEQLKLTSSFDS